MVVNTLYQDYPDRERAKRMPKMLKVKIKFIRKCVSEIAELSSVKNMAESLASDFERLANIRHNLIHSAIASLMPNNGVFSYVKLSTEKDFHTIDQYNFNLGEFPKLAEELVNLGSKSVTLA